MAIRTIREIGDPVLNKISKEVKEITPRVQDLIDDMFESRTRSMGRTYVIVDYRGEQYIIERITKN